MAEGTTAKFPPEIVMNDDDPKGFVTLFLTIPGLKVKKATLFSKAEPKNGSVAVTFNDESLNAETKVDTNSRSVEYVYAKKMPEKIKPDKSSYKVKEELLVLRICKETSESWAAHQKYLMRKD